MDDILFIQSRIYHIRGVKVMLDRDLAFLYRVETKVLNQAVKRNLRRFPSDFMFQLTKEEFELWKSQIVTSNGDKKGLRRPPYAFTEQGVAMLSGILNSDVAIDTNIMIMRAFVAVRNLLSIPEPADKIAQIEKEIVAIKEEMNLILADQNDINEMTQAQLDAISVVLAELQTNGNNAPRRRIGYSTEKK